MSFKRLTLLPVVGAACLALPGCNTPDPQSGSPDPGFGEAVKYNAAVQIIDPDPTYDEASSQAGDSGVKGAEAVKRYRTDRVKAVETIQTTSGTGGTGSGPQ